MTENKLLKAYFDYDFAVSEFEREHPFDLMTAMDRPNPPTQSIAAQAGELIQEHHSLAGAMAVALTDAMSRDIPDNKRAVYMELVSAAVEA